MHVDHGVNISKVDLQKAPRQKVMLLPSMHYCRQDFRFPSLTHKANPFIPCLWPKKTLQSPIQSRIFQEQALCYFHIWHNIKEPCQSSSHQGMLPKPFFQKIFCAIKFRWIYMKDIHNSNSHLVSVIIISFIFVMDIFVHMDLYFKQTKTEFLACN